MTTNSGVAKAAAIKNAIGAAQLGLTVEQYCGLTYMRRSILRKFENPRQVGIEKGWLDAEGNPTPYIPRPPKPVGAIKAVEKLPRFLNQIKAHDFQAVAAEGCYVYAYLRTKISDNGKAGSPYYVGKATSAGRPFEIKTHTVKIPRNKRMVRVLASGLTNEQALALEVRFISHYGRIDLGTGILQNRTPGGDDGPGFTDEMRQRRIDSQKEEKAAERGVELDEYLGLSESDRQAFLKWHSRNPEKSIADWRKVVPSRNDTTARNLARSKKAAKGHGVPFERWQQLTEKEREAFNKWHKVNPEKSLDDWLASPRQRGLNSEETRLKAAQKSADTLGVALEDWLALTKKEQNAFRVWWLRHKGTIAEWQKARRW